MSLSSLTSNRGSNTIGNNANIQVGIQEPADMILPSLAFSLATPSEHMLQLVNYVQFLQILHAFVYNQNTMSLSLKS